MGPRHIRVFRGADACHGRMCRRRKPRSPRPDPRPAWLRQRRGDHPEALAQRVRRRSARHRLRVIEVTTAEELAAAFGPGRARLHSCGSPRNEGPTQHAGDLSDRAAEGRPVLVGRSRRDPDRPQRASPAAPPSWRTAEGSAWRTTDGGPAARPQESRPRRLGSQRAAHGVGRSMKVGNGGGGRDAHAVEMWSKRDHTADGTAEPRWLEHIARVFRRPEWRRPSFRPSVSPHVTPSLLVTWIAEARPRRRLGRSSSARHRPRVAMFPASGPLEEGPTGVSITHYMLSPGEEKIVARPACTVSSSNPPRKETPHRLHRLRTCPARGT